METKDKTPKLHSQDASNIQLNINSDVSENKGKRFKGSTKRVYDLFLSGGKYSVVELTTILRVPDPRSSIRSIRKMGVSISDYWVKTVFSKYKVYFLK